jgi:hypothetical protein
MHESSVANVVVERGERARGLSLGAAMGIVIALFGISVPLAAMACERVMRAVDAVMAPPTVAVTSVHPVVFLLMAGVIAGLLVGKERVLRSRAAIAVNVSAAVIATLLGAAMLVAVIMPLIMIGKSSLGE